VIGHALDDFFEHVARQVHLAGLQVTQAEIHARAHLVRAVFDDLFVEADARG
jgi:hypothetical protein